VCATEQEELVVSRFRRVAVALALAVLPIVSLPNTTAAQTQPARGKLLVTVADPSGAIVAGADVTLVGIDDATKAAAIAPAKTTDKGAATFDGLVPGRYSLSADFPGFGVGLLRDIKINRGDNKHVIVLPLKNLNESVTVGRDLESKAADRAANAFGLTMTQQQIEALSDDPNEMQRQIMELAGPDAILRVDSFEGQQLPPKSQIKSIHVTRDQFAAETEQPGSTFVDVITQPGIGPIRGGVNTTFRDGSMSAKSQFNESKGPEQFKVFGANIGGALVHEKSNFSLAINGQDQYVTPTTTLALPDGTRRFEVLNMRQPSKNMNVNALLDYALTRDQTLRFGYSQNNGRRSNLGVGAYDLPERAYSADQNAYTFRALEAGPIGRRMFINTRMTMTWRDFGNTSAVEAPTIIVQDSVNSGGAQQAGRVHGKNLTAASDLDYIRGIHSWRGGVQVYADWYSANLNNNYLGTFIFANNAALQAGTPVLYTRSIGDPQLNFFHARIGAYFQDDIRVRKGLTLSPGLRYSYQTRVDDTLAFEPRLGVTWAVNKSGKTTLRASGGIFHGWLDPGIWWQTVRYDGEHQREVVITNPSYPNPGTGGLLPLANTYRLGEYKLNKNVRYSAGIDQRISPRASFNLLYNYYHQDQLPRGENTNPIVNGLRADPLYANVIVTVTDAQIRRHEFFANFNASLFAPGPAANAAKFNWRRMNVTASYSYIRARRNALGPFDVPASGTLDTEWGPGPADNPYRVNLSLTSTQMRNLSVALLVNASDGGPYTETTGLDNNHDGLLNDRPAGVGIWSLRGASLWTLSTRVAYNIPLGMTGANAQRYRMSLFASINNLTNHANLVGYSGIMTSPFFMTATAVQNPRKVDIGMNISF